MKRMIKAIKRFSYKSVGRWFHHSSDPEVIDLISIENARNLYRFSLIITMIEIVSVLSFTIMNHDIVTYLHQLFNVGCCIVACMIVALMSKKILIQYRKTGIISSKRLNFIVMLFYVLLSVWGTYVDVWHYQKNEQMLTFYIVQFCFLCFIVMLPKAGCILIVLSFSFLYYRLFRIDGAVGIQPQNYIIFMLIAIMGNAIQYTILKETEKNKVKIFALNQILQKEAKIDDLTQIKNRNALNSDMEKYIGQSIYVIMADIDYFKRYNDTYGHIVGDQVLSKVAASIQETFQSADAYRYGGDEFLIILTNYSKEKFESGIGRWKEAISKIRVPGVTLSIACSSGYANGRPRDLEELKEIVNRADEWLYNAKKDRK